MCAEVIFEEVHQILELRDNRVLEDRCGEILSPGLDRVTRLIMLDVVLGFLPIGVDPLNCSNGLEPDFFGFCGGSPEVDLSCDISKASFKLFIVLGVEGGFRIDGDVVHHLVVEGGCDAVEGLTDLRNFFCAAFAASEHRGGLLVCGGGA